MNIYDSLNLEPDSGMSQICAILKYEVTIGIVTVNKVPVQQQHGSVDCGLFAIANIVALCFGYEPNKILFRQDRIRNHLFSCLEAGQFSLFPFDVNTRPKRNKTQKIRVYCTCRHPHDGTKMIKCVNCELSSKLLMCCLSNRSALAVNCCVIIHCLEVNCKDQITSVQHD